MGTGIYDEIEREWRAACEDAWLPSLERGDFNKFLSDEESEARSTTVIGLQPALAILEFGIEWLSYVHIALSEKLFDNGLQPPRLRASWALIGSAVSFGLAIRTLCLSGFDTPARALLRSYVEILFLCLAALDDANLAEAYLDADDDAKAKTFWHTWASPKHLHNRIIQLEKKIGFDSEIIHSMTEWRRQEYEILSQASHLAYDAAVLTARSPLLGSPDKLQVGIFGAATHLSRRTIAYAAATTWYFSRLSYDFLLGYDTRKSLLAVDKEDEWHRRMVFVREALSQVTIAHWKELS